VQALRPVQRCEVTQLEELLLRVPLEMEGPIVELLEPCNVLASHFGYILLIQP